MPDRNSKKKKIEEIEPGREERERERRETEGRARGRQRTKRERERQRERVCCPPPSKRSLLTFFFFPSALPKFSSFCLCPFFPQKRVFFSSSALSRPFELFAHERTHAAREKEGTQAQALEASEIQHVRRRRRRKKLIALAPNFNSSSSALRTSFSTSYSLRCHLPLSL